MMSSIYSDLLKQIEKAKTEAIKRGINANRIIIDEGLAYTEGFTEVFKTKIGDNNSTIKDPESCYLVKSDPMILGLAIEFQKGLREELGLNFIIDDRANPSREEQLEKELRKYKKVLKLLKECFEMLVDNLGIVVKTTKNGRQKMIYDTRDDTEYMYLTDWEAELINKCIDELSNPDEEE